MHAVLGEADDVAQRNRGHRRIAVALGLLRRRLVPGAGDARGPRLALLVALQLELQIRRERDHREELALEARRRFAGDEHDGHRLLEQPVRVHLVPGFGRYRAPRHQPPVPVRGHADHPLRRPVVIHQRHGQLDRALGGRERRRRGL